MFHAKPQGPCHVTNSSHMYVSDGAKTCDLEGKRGDAEGRERERERGRGGERGGRKEGSGQGCLVREENTQERSEDISEKRGNAE